MDFMPLRPPLRLGAAISCANWTEQRPAHLSGAARLASGGGILQSCALSKGRRRQILAIMTSSCWAGTAGAF